MDWRWVLYPFPLATLEAVPLCLQGNRILCHRAWRRLQDRNARGKVLPSCRTSTSGTWMPVSVWVKVKHPFSWVLSADPAGTLRLWLRAF